MGWRKLLMEIYYPEILSRKKAINMTGLSRKTLEKLATNGIIKVFTTKGGHRRYFREDLINLIKNFK
jgi:DNA-binding transcriptional MerR regulator